jgi:hypothetical protein
MLSNQLSCICILLSSLSLLSCFVSTDSSGTKFVFGASRPGVRFPERSDILHFVTSIQRWVLDSLLSKAQLPDLKANNTPRSSAKVEIAEALLPFALNVFFFYGVFRSRVSPCTATSMWSIVHPYWISNQPPYPLSTGAMLRSTSPENSGR